MNVQKMERRRPLALDPARPFAIKRNVHEWVIGAGAHRFAEAFAEVMRRPHARFGAIEVQRMPGREGQPFVAGERFAGCVKLPHFPLAGWLEDNFFSDFAEIVEMAPLRVVYRYLSGCPMAGTSTFEVEPLGEHCRMRVIFEHQELGGMAITVLHRFGIRMHDRVTQAQVAAACESIGAPILSTTLASTLE
jgi:hypothetical protein